MSVNVILDRYYWVLSQQNNRTMYSLSLQINDNLIFPTFYIFLTFPQMLQHLSHVYQYFPYAQTHQILLFPGAITSQNPLVFLLLPSVGGLSRLGTELSPWALPWLFSLTEFWVLDPISFPFLFKSTFTSNLRGKKGSWELKSWSLACLKISLS